MLNILSLTVKHCNLKRFMHAFFTRLTGAVARASLVSVLMRRYLLDDQLPGFS